MWHFCAGTRLDAPLLFPIIGSISELRLASALCDSSICTASGEHQDWCKTPAARMCVNCLLKACLSGLFSSIVHQPQSLKPDYNLEGCKCIDYLHGTMERMCCKPWYQAALCSVHVARPTCIVHKPPLIRVAQVLPRKHEDWPRSCCAGSLQASSACLQTCIRTQAVGSISCWA